MFSNPKCPFQSPVLVLWSFSWIHLPHSIFPWYRNLVPANLPVPKYESQPSSHLMESCMFLRISSIFQLQEPARMYRKSVLLYHTPPYHFHSHNTAEIEQFSENLSIFYLRNPYIYPTILPKKKTHILGLLLLFSWCPVQNIHMILTDRRIL